MSAGLGFCHMADQLDICINVQLKRRIRQSGTLSALLQMILSEMLLIYSVSDRSTGY